MESRPIAEGGAGRAILIENQPQPDAENLPFTTVDVVTQGAIDLLRLPLVRGRSFDATDNADGAAVMLVNEDMVQRYWNGASPLGDRIRLGGLASEEPWRTVVGIGSLAAFALGRIIASVTPGMSAGDPPTPIAVALVLTAAAMLAVWVPTRRAVRIDPAGAGAAQGLTMGKGEYLGEFEMVVMLTLLHLGDGAYGMTIRVEIEERTGRAVSIGAVYTTLRRLQRKGYVAAELGEPSPSRGGRAKKHFRLEPEGMEALQRSREMFARLWRDADVPESS